MQRSFAVDTLLVIVITQRRLQHALSVAEHAHFGRAAAALHISQPALTRSIQALEAELGVELFDRIRGRVVLTAYGEIVVRRGRALLRDHEDLRHEILLLAGRESGALNIALGPHPGAISGFAAVGRLSAMYPKITVSAQMHTRWREVTQSVVEGKVHLAILDQSRAQEDVRVQTELVGEHAGRFFCRPGHPILRRRSITLADLMNFPWVSSRLPPRVTALFPAALGRAGQIDPLQGDFVPAIEIDSLTQFADVIAGTNALALVPLIIADLALAERRISVVPVIGFEPKTRYAFAMSKDRPPSSLVNAYMQEVRAIEAQTMKREKVLLREYPGRA